MFAKSFWERFTKTLPKKPKECKTEEEAEKPLMKLDELPESCLSMIFRLTSPRDVCRLSVLSRALKSAGNSDYVWQAMLPPQYHLLRLLADQPLESSSKKNLYFKLCHPIFFDNGTKKFWVDKATGKICFMLSARVLDITCGNDGRYWRWISRRDCSFQETAQLFTVCWLEIFGKFDTKFLSHGTAYTVSFVLKLEAGHFGWDSKPIVFDTTIGGHKQEFARFVEDTEKAVDVLGYEMSTMRRLANGFLEFDAGEFVVDENDDHSLPISFHMIKLEPNWQGGLSLDGVKIQPTSLIQNRNNRG